MRHRVTAAIMMLPLIVSLFASQSGHGSESPPATSGSSSRTEDANSSRMVEAATRQGLGSNTNHRHADANRTGYRILRDHIQSPQWREAVAKARAHASGRGHYSLMRVFVDDALPTEMIQMQGTKLKELTTQYSGGGGEFRTVQSGEFVLFEHINSTRRRDRQDPVKLGSPLHGTTTIWLTEPRAGEPAIVGDVILDRCPHESMGVLSISIKGCRAPQSTLLTVGSVVVGGPYGSDHRFNNEGQLTLRLPPGEYKILFPQFNLRTSRWDVEIESGKETSLTYEATNSKIVRTTTPAVPVEKSDSDSGL